MTDKNLVERHGVLVLPDEVAVSGFLRKVLSKNGENKRYEGTLKELTALVKANIDNYEPGTGSVAGDVRLVRVPTTGFFTNIVKIDKSNFRNIKTRWEARVKGEAPFAKQYIPSDELIPASVVKIVVYRADVLARDSDRSSDAEWEIVAILADPTEDVPMHPATMARNALREVGGTYREYDNEEWARAVKFWNEHVYIEPEQYELVDTKELFADLQNVWGEIDWAEIVSTIYEHEPMKMLELEDSIDKFGMREPLRVRRFPDYNRLENGHHRAAIALRTGINKVPVIFEDAEASYIEVKISGASLTEDDLYEAIEKYISSWAVTPEVWLDSDIMAGDVSGVAVIYYMRNMKLSPEELIEAVKLRLADVVKIEEITYEIVED